MVTATGNFANLLEPGIRDIFGDTYNEFQEEYTSMFDTMSSTRSFEEIQEITGFGLLTEKVQGASVDYDDPLQGYKTTLTNITYGLGFNVTREMFEDDQYNKINAMPKALAMSARQTIENVAANVYNRAFNASYTGADSSVLCATDHASPAGGTYSNKATTNSDLSETSFEQALIDIAAYTNARGLKINAMPKTLLVHPNDFYQASKILKSGQEPESANNAINPAQGILPGGFKVCHWFSDSDAWFIRTNVQSGMIFLWRRRIELTRDNVFDSENAKFKATMRFKAGWADPRGLYGNAGA